MLCPYCRHPLPDNAGSCPACGRRPGPFTGRDNGRDDVLEPELMPDMAEADPSGRGHTGYRQDVRQGFTRVFYTSFPNGSGTLPPACLPTVITMALALMAAFRFGILAAIGFLVFAGIGRAVTFLIRLRHVMEGRAINPWIFHLASWFVCWWLVAWLSGNPD